MTTALTELLGDLYDEVPEDGVYLIHFNGPFKHAGHYIGWSSDLAARLLEHAAGQGARLMAVIKEAGITWRVGRLYPGATRTRERSLKRQGGAARACLICRAERGAAGLTGRGRPAPSTSDRSPTTQGV